MENKTMPIIIITLVVVGGGLFFLKSAADKGEIATDDGGSATEDTVVEQANEDGKPLTEYDNVSSLESGVWYLFVGSTCPHCHDVEDFIMQNQLKDSLNVKFVEVFDATENQKFYLKAFTECGQEVESISVPVLYKDGECVTGGSKAIIDKLKGVSGVE